MFRMQEPLLTIFNFSMMHLSLLFVPFLYSWKWSVHKHDIESANLRSTIFSQHACDLHSIALLCDFSLIGYKRHPFPLICLPRTFFFTSPSLFLLLVFCSLIWSHKEPGLVAYQNKTYSSLLLFPVLNLSP